MNKKSILWLSDKTLKSYVTWKKLTIKYSELHDKSKEESLMVMVALENLLLDFRKDIGHENKNIKTGDILSLFITDFKNYNLK